MAVAFSLGYYLPVLETIGLRTSVDMVDQPTMKSLRSQRLQYSENVSTLPLPHSYIIFRRPRLEKAPSGKLTILFQDMSLHEYDHIQRTDEVAKR